MTFFWMNTNWPNTEQKCTTQHKCVIWNVSIMVDWEWIKNTRIKRIPSHLKTLKLVGMCFSICFHLQKIKSPQNTHNPNRNISHFHTTSNQHPSNIPIWKSSLFLYLLLIDTRTTEPKMGIFDGSTQYQSYFLQHGKYRKFIKQPPTNLDNITTCTEFSPDDKLKENPTLIPLIPDVYSPITYDIPILLSSNSKDSTTMPQTPNFIFSNHTEH